MSAAAPELASRLALDAADLSQLKLQAKADPQGAIKAAARQFEALFMSMMLKSMREATPQDGPFDSEQTRMYTSMLDQQLAQALAKRGTGLADVMARQLSRGAAPGQDAAATPDDASKQSFIQGLLPAAREASGATGIPARFLIGQAALESGWGERQIRGADGRPSFNLFGVKAGAGWKGDVVEATTTEYIDGAAQKTSARFRAYGSYAEAFRDYASIMRDTPRYAEALGQAGDAAGFARGLQKAGYATDPLYADKLERIFSSPRLRTVA